MIRFSCNNCEKKLKVPYEYVSKKVKCPGCSTALVVPAPPEPEQPSDEANIFSDLKSDLEQMESQGTVDHEQNEILRESRQQEKQQEIDDTQWHEAPKKKKPKKEASDSSDSSVVKLLLSIALGVVGAAIGAGVWALVALLTFFFLGKLSGMAVVCLGAVTGTGVVIGGHKTGIKLAIISAVLTICGILGGKYIMINVAADTVTAVGRHAMNKQMPKEVHDQIAADPTMLGMAAVFDMYLAGSVSEDNKDEYQTVYFDEDFESASPEIQDLHKVAMARSEEWDRPTRYQKVIAWRNSLFVIDDDTRKKAILRSFSIFEIIGSLVAIGLAFRIGMGHYSHFG